MSAHEMRKGKQGYPHAGGCVACREEGKCNACGTPTPRSKRCNNGRCSKCHDTRCTPIHHGYGK